MIFAELQARALACVVVVLDEFQARYLEQASEPGSSSSRRASSTAGAGSAAWVPCACKQAVRISPGRDFSGARLSIPLE